MNHGPRPNGNGRSARLSPEHEARVEELLRTTGEDAISKRLGTSIVTLHKLLTSGVRPQVRDAIAERLGAV